VLSSATATFHQTFDRDWNPSGRWRHHRGQRLADDQASGSGDQTLSATALITLATPLGPGPQALTVTIYQNNGAAHLLGDFALG